MGVEEAEPVQGLLGCVPTGAAGLVGRRDDGASQGRQDLEAFFGEHVLAFVEVAGARRTEAVFGAPETVGTYDREHGSFGDRLGRSGDA